MKRAISFLCWIGVVVTIVCLVLTLSTTYSIYYIKYFSGYYALQWSIFYTMLVWAVNLFITNFGRRKYIYLVISVFFALGAAVFRAMRVF